jgi:protein TonB
MKSALFFILSLALHIAALVYLVSFPETNQAQMIQMTILPMEQESGDAMGRGGNGNLASQAASKAAGRTSRFVQPVIEAKPTSNQEPLALSTEAPAKFSESSVTLVAAIANSQETNSATTLGSTGDDTHGFGAGGSGTAGNGLGPSGAGSGQGNGQGSAGNEIVLTQARYRDTPRPDYPESARREGREGRVLLRVLVDDQGRSKQVEINSSSGSEALDRAAAEAIKQWRFVPARFGDQAVESWLRIPIEFRLADAKSR